MIPTYQKTDFPQSAPRQTRMCTHLHSFKWPVWGQLAKDSQGTDSWLIEGRNGSMLLYQWAINQTHTARQGKHRKQETISFIPLKRKPSKCWLQLRAFSMAKFLSMALSCGVLIRAAITLPCTLSEELCVSYTVCCTATVICFPN